MLLILVPSTPQEADRLYLVMEYCQLSVRYSTFICVCCPQPHKQEADRLYLVMEYCAGGDLAHLLRAVKRLPEAAAQHLMRQLAAGLRQMWAHHLVHVRPHTGGLPGCLLRQHIGRLLGCYQMCTPTCKRACATLHWLPSHLPA